MRCQRKPNRAVELAGEHAERKKLSYARPTNITREAELRRPTVIGSGDLFGVTVRVVDGE